VPTVAVAAELISPELDRLCEAIAEEDYEAMANAVDDALQAVDTLTQRSRLAAAVIALREAGRLDARIRATALIDLASSSDTFLCASLLEAVAVRVGAVRTPAGVLLAA
jgi:hypothetical protein